MIAQRVETQVSIHPPWFDSRHRQVSLFPGLISLMKSERTQRVISKTKILKLVSKKLPLKGLSQPEATGVSLKAPVGSRLDQPLVAAEFFQVSKLALQSSNHDLNHILKNYSIIQSVNV